MAGYGRKFQGRRTERLKFGRLKVGSKVSPYAKSGFEQRLFNEKESEKMGDDKKKENILLNIYKGHIWDI